MIASAHGYHTDLAELRRRSPISLKGATLAQLIRHAEALGFAARQPSCPVTHSNFGRA
jgi:ATP-binding cassette subfamily B protein RaxB